MRIFGITYGRVMKTATKSSPSMMEIVLDREGWGLKGCRTVLHLKEMIMLVLVNRKMS